MHTLSAGSNDKCRTLITLVIPKPEADYAVGTLWNLGGSEPGNDSRVCAAYITSRDND